MKATKRFYAVGVTPGGNRRAVSPTFNSKRLVMNWLQAIRQDERWGWERNGYRILIVERHSRYIEHALKENRRPASKAAP